jgi:hypothetical protein
MTGEVFDINEAISNVIQKFNKIEEELKEILTLYIEPSIDKRSFTKNFLFHNSIISFAGKLKLFAKINSEMDWIENKYIQDFYSISSIRNAFAHSPTTDTQPSLSFPIKFPAKFQYHVEVSHSKDVFKLRAMEELYVEFNEKYEKLYSSLVEIKKSFKMKKNNHLLNRR